MTRIRIPIPALLAALAAIAGVTLAACGDDDDTASVGDPAGAAAADAADDSDDAVEVTLVDYDFEGLPATVAAGTRFTVVNESETELHELVAFRLPDGEGRALAELLALPPEEMGPALGGEPAAVLLAAPGGPQIDAVGDGTMAEAGRYAILCFIPTGADPDEYLTAAAETEGGPPQGVAGGPPHFVNGMAAEVTVE